MVALINQNQFLKRNITNKNVLIPLILILILGSLLRFYGLENQSLWNDELESWRISSYDNLFAVIKKGVRYDVHPPGYYVLLYYVEKYIGVSESVLRFPSAVSGILSIFIIFLVGLRLYSYKEGLIASALMAVLWCPIYYSQEARANSMLLLFILLATYFWMLVLESLSERTTVSYYTIFGYIISAVISCYLHYFGLYLVTLQGLGAVLFFIRRREALFYVLLIYFAILLAYLPWWPIMFYQLWNNMGMIAWIEPPKSIAFVYYLEFLFNKSRILLLVVLMLYSFLVLRSLYSILKTKEYRNMRIMLLSPGLLLVLWLIIPFVGVYIKSVLSAPILTYRNLIISLPAAYLLLSRSITQLPLCSRNQAIIAFIIVGLLLSHLIFSMDYYSKPHKEQFREAVDFIVKNDYLYEGSLIIGYAWSQDYFNYYFERKGSTRRINVRGGQEKDILNVAKLIRTENPQYIWYICAHRVPDAEFIDFLNKNLALIDYKKFIRANVWLFENK